MNKYKNTFNDSYIDPDTGELPTIAKYGNMVMPRGKVVWPSLEAERLASEIYGSNPVEYKMDRKK